VAWSPDGKTLASGAEDKTVRLWDVATRKHLRTLEGHEGRVYIVKWSPNGNTLASCSSDNNAKPTTVKIWEADSGKVLHTIEGSTPISAYHAVAWSPNGSKMAFGGEFNTVGLWEENSSKPIRHLVGHKEPVNSLAWSRDGKTLASGTGPRIPDNPRFWDIESGTVKQIIKAHGDIWSWSPDLNNLATFRSGGGSNTAQLIERKSGKATFTLKGHTGPHVTCTDWAPDGKTVATSGMDGTVRLWEASSGKQLDTLRHPNQGVWWVTWSPDGKSLASSAGHVVYIWNAKKAKLKHTLEGHKRNVGRLAWSPDGTKLATGSNDNTYRIWKTATGKVVRIIQGKEVSYADFLAWSPDGRVLATGGDASILFWEADTGIIRARLFQLPHERSLVLHSTGHYRGTLGIEREIVYVVQTAKGQETLTPKEFAKKYSWKNDPKRVRLGK
jgi:WD40 repeat protein